MQPDILEELTEQTLKKLGISRDKFEKEVAALKENSSTEVIANLMTVVMESMDATATVLSLIMQQNMDLQMKVALLEGGNANA